ncbi:MAG: hypothetical protein LBE62_12885 [Azonexus sp.]|nr:hypothetical protein [Azonexus sp.]
MPHIKKTHRLAQITIAIACMIAPAASFADCQSAKPATTADIAAGQAKTLLESMISACKAQDPTAFFSLQTEGANKLLATTSTTDKEKLFGQYCAFTTEAVNQLGGNIETAVHSIGPYKNGMKCGIPSSYWFVHNKSGKLALRLEIAVESGQLKIDTH